MSKKISGKKAADQVAFTCKMAFKQHGIASNEIISQGSPREISLPLKFGTKNPQVTMEAWLLDYYL